MTTRTTATEPSSTAAASSRVTAADWFARGARVAYDPATGKVGEAASPDSLSVWRRIDGPALPEAIWTTFMPGYPDGSFGWAQVDQELGADARAPKLFVEYVGQGDSDKPAHYPYGSMERADLIEALWEAEGVQSTFLASFDYSSLVVLELLSRRLDRAARGDDPGVMITGVVLINGGYFADSHSHPLITTPALNSPMGGLITWMGQHSRFAGTQLLGRVRMFSKAYHVSGEELAQMYDVISRRNGFRFLSRAAGFRPEHQQHYAERWDLERLFSALGESVSFHVVGSEDDPFEHKQVTKARERLGPQGLEIRMLPGGHLTTSEQPQALARIIAELAP